MGTTLYWNVTPTDIATFGAYALQAGNSLSFDITVSEMHIETSDITKHPVEQGEAITDHSRPEPAELTLEVFVSNAPINPPTSDAVVQSLPLTLQTPMDPSTTFSVQGTGPSFLVQAASELNDAFHQAVTVQVTGGTGQLARYGFPTFLQATTLQFHGEVDYVKQTYAQLKTLKDTATLIVVVSPKWLYENMLIKSFEMHRGHEEGTGASFTIHIQEIRVVSSQVTAAPQPTIPRATPPQNVGKKDGTAQPAPPRKALDAANVDAGRNPFALPGT